jgi:hypothetical protein
MTTFRKSAYGLTLAALPGMIALGLTAAAPAHAQDDAGGATPPGNIKPHTIHETLGGAPGNAQNGNNARNPGDQMGASDQTMSGNVSIAAAGNYVYIFRDGRLYQLRSSGLALISRKNIGDNRMSASANNATGAGNIATFHRSAQSGDHNTNSGNANNGGNNVNNTGNPPGGYNISSEGGSNGSGATANSEISQPQSGANGQGVVTANGDVNPRRPVPGQGVTESGANGPAGPPAYNPGAMMAMNMAPNVRVAATGNYVYVLNGNMLYQLRAADMTVISRRDLTHIDSARVWNGSAAGNVRANRNPHSNQ